MCFRGVKVFICGKELMNKTYNTLTLFPIAKAFLTQQGILPFEKNNGKMGNNIIIINHNKQIFLFPQLKSLIMFHSPFRRQINSRKLFSAPNKIWRFLEIIVLLTVYEHFIFIIPFSFIFF